MAWFKERHRKDGSPYYCVFFRELNHETGKMQQSTGGRWCSSWCPRGADGPRPPRCSPATSTSPLLNSMHAQGLGQGAPQSRDRMYVVF